MRKISIIRKIPVIAFIASFIVCISAFIVLPSTAEYKISYNLDGGAFESQTKTKYTSTDYFSISNPVKKGYEFLGWTGSNGDTPQLSLGSVYGKTGDKSYTANWKLITYSVTYNLDGGFVSGNPTYYNINSMFRLYEPVKRGYIFLGWTGSNGDTPMRDVLVKSGNTGNLEFIANWEYIQTYSITYNLNGGSVSGNPTSYNKFSNTITLNTPTRSGYYFLGWTGSNGSNPEKSVTIPSGSTGNKTYTANWEYIQTYSISYNLNGGSVSGNPTSYNKFSNTITLNTPTRSGYEFLGWTGSNGSTPEKSVTIPSGSTGNKTYTANWKAIKYTITYKLDGGENSESNIQEYTIETSFTFISPTKQYYTFMGWYKDANFQSKIDSIRKGTIGDIVLYAKWELTKYTITYNLNGGINNKDNLTTFTVNDLPIKLNSPSLDNIEFYGWKENNSNNYITEISSCENYYLYATWGETYILSEDKTYYMVSGKSCSLKEVVIKDSYNGLPVKSIVKNAFSGCRGLTSITIPNSVTSIGSSAFYYCDSLTSIYYTGTIKDWCNITFSDYDSNPMCYASHFYIKNSNGEYEELTKIEIPNTITKINNYAFCRFKNVTRVTIPNSVTSIGSHAFSYCSSLTSITIGNSVTSIGSSAFYGCDSLTSITIGNSVTSIGNYAFYKCRSLISVIIPDSVTSIGDDAFFYCESLKSVIIGNSVTSIGDSAFCVCSSLTSIYYTGTIENWCNITFSYDSNPMCYESQFYIKNSNGEYEELTEIEIPSSITQIKDYAFSDFNNVTKVTIPNSVTSIGNYAFYGCSSLTSVYYTGTIEDWCNITFSDYYSNPMCYASHFYIKNSNGEYEELTEIEIPNTITKINNYAFYRLKNVTRVTIPDSVTSIGDEAFYCCSSLKSITIPNSVTSIGRYAFSDCSSLTNITIGNSVTSIGSSAFSGCSSLKSITIPNSVTSIGRYAFSDCSSLQKMTLPFVGGSETKNTFLGYIFGGNEYKENSNYVPKSLKKVTITKSIGGYAFYDCSSLTNITIQNSVTNIGDYAFYYCRSLTNITIPNSVTSIGEWSFSGCNNLEEITLPFVGKSETRDIYFHYIFGDSNNVPKSLKKVTITKSIGDSAFRNCRSLTSIIIGDSVTSIGSSAFYNCSNLTSVTIGNSVTSIGNSAFYNCSNLTSVTIGNSVTSIGNSAFLYCSSLTSITIPDSVTSIGSSAFYLCSSLTSVYYTGTIENWCNITFSYYDSNPMYYASQFYIKNSNGEYEELTKIEIPSTITEIKDYAFSGFNNVTKVTIPNSVISIGNCAFEDCRSLQYNIYDNAKYLGNNENPYLVLVEAINKNITTCTINSNTKFIHSDAFKGCSGLTSIIIPDSVTSIGNSAFEGCNSLQYNIYDNAKYLGKNDNPYFILVKAINKDITTCTINSNTKFIHSDAFSGCSRLTSITIPDSVKSIGDDAFRGCSSLTSITIPNSVTSIGYFAFYNCSSLTSVYYTGTIKDWCNITFSAYDSNPMYYASHFYIKNSNEGYKELTEIEIPNTVTKINDYAFYGFNNVTKVIIQKNITSIELGAFYNCYYLSTVYYKGSEKDWNSISIKVGNDYLKKATIYYYSETKPSASGNYWHYNTSGEIEIW